MDVDAVMLSYDEPEAARLHALVEERLARQVKRLHGVRGMRRAYRLAAEVVDTQEFLLFDGDFEVDESFASLRVHPLDAGVSMRVWSSVNPVNGLVYGYGGPKLVCRDALRAMAPALDVLAGMPGRVEFSALVAGTTRIDQDAFHVYKAAFRECAMLTRGSEYAMSAQGTAERLRIWTSVARGPFAAHALRGASDGVTFARTAAPSDLDAINDPQWLRERFAPSTKVSR